MVKRSPRDSGPGRSRRPSQDKRPVRRDANRPPPGIVDVVFRSRQIAEFVASRKAEERELDLEDVRDAILNDEKEIANEELLYLISGCREFWPAYLLLAELALEEGNIPLAQGHYGFVYENGLKSLPKSFRGRLPHGQGYNPHFFAAGRGLARCLIARQQIREGQDILERLRHFDAEEPETQSLWEQLQEKIAGRPNEFENLNIVQLDLPADDGDEDDDE